MQSSPEGASFTGLALRTELLTALSALGYEEPTPIQREAIPPLLAGRDLLGQAATGTGKTAAFALPILQRLAAGERGDGPGGVGARANARAGRAGLRGVPPLRPGARRTRPADLRRAADRPAAGGAATAASTSWSPRLAARSTTSAVARLDLREVRDGRARRGRRDARHGLRRGHRGDPRRDRRAAADRAVLGDACPRASTRIARRYLRDPVRIEIGRQQAPAGEAPQVRQSAYIVARPHKPAALGRMLDVESPTAAIVFCRTREEVDELTETLNGRGYRAEALHGGMSQDQRDRVMGRLRSGTADLLIATDVAARGLDIDQLTHVVNYNVPSAAEAYVHRIGRVGRAGREGVAITLAEPREHRMLKTIEQLTKQRITIEKVPDRRRPAQPPTGADACGAAGEPRRRRRPRPLPGRGRVARRRVRHHGRRARGGETGARVQRRRTRRAGDPRSLRRDHPQAAALRTRDAETAGAGTRSDGDTTRLFFGVGRRSGIRPQDLVGAIANESRLSGRDIGAIEIADRFSLVEVPSSAADEVIEALRHSTIKGKKATVRREGYPPRRQGR